MSDTPDEPQKAAISPDGAEVEARSKSAGSAAEAAAAGGEGAPSDGTDSSGADVIELRAEVEELREELVALESTSAPQPQSHRARSVFAVILIVLGSVLAPIAGITVWVRNQVLNTDRYVATVAPLSKNPAIASVMATEVTNQLFSHVDVQGAIKDVLPPRADFIAAPLSSAIKGATLTAANKVIASNQFNKVWVGINRQAHQALVGVLTGSGTSAITANKNGKVTLDLRKLAEQVVKQMDQQGITIFDKVPLDKINLQIVLLQSKGLVQAQQLTQLLDHLALFLPLLSLLCFAGAVALSPRHLRALMWSGLGLAMSMAALAVILGLLRSYLISASAGHALTPEAAQALFDTMLRYLKEGLRIVFAAGLLVAFGAWLAGPSRPAKAIRRAPAEFYRWADRGIREQGWEFGAFGQWIAANRAVSQGVLVGVAVLLLVIWGNPGIGGVLIVALVTGFLMLVVHNIAGKPPGVAGAGSGGPPSSGDSTSPATPKGPS